MPRLNDAEVDRLLRRSPILHIATTGADGAPFVVPVAYLYRDGEILLTAREKVSWLANLRRDPRVCLSVDQVRYPLAKLTVRGEAEIRYEPGQDDLWRDVRLPIADADAAPIRVLDDGSEEWLYDHAYHTVTHDEPRALVVIALARSKVTSWRMPLVGEYVDASWPASYYRNRPRRFRVTEVGPTLRDVKVISEPEREDS